MAMEVVAAFVTTLLVHSTVVVTMVMNWIRIEKAVVVSYGYLI